MANPKNTDFISEFSDPAQEQEDANAAAERARREAGGEDFASLLKESMVKGRGKKLSVGDKIKGKILVIGQEDVFISTGGQHDGVMNRRELVGPDGQIAFKQDEVVEVYVTQVRGTEIRVSRNPTDKNLAEDLEDAFDMMLPIAGRVVEICNGGVRVNIKGKIAFCPISQLDIKRTETGEEFVGKSLEFRITKFAEGGRNIVVSRRALLEEERELSVGSFLEDHKDGDIVPGRVSKFEKFGAFVELTPGVDGLVHISEIAWSRISDPSEVLQVGQDVVVKILKREVVNGRPKISLSIKQASERPEPVADGASAAHGAGTQTINLSDPWSKYSVGQVVEGKINRKEPYGLFVQLEPGITGLLHNSRTHDRPDFKIEKLRVGDTVSVQVAEIKASERRISLDVPRDPGEDDWKTHTQEASSFGTLGDQLKAALAKKK